MQTEGPILKRHCFEHDSDMSSHLSWTGKILYLSNIFPEIKFPQIYSNVLIFIFFFKHFTKNKMGNQ